MKLLNSGSWLENLGRELEYKKLANARFKYAVRFIAKNEQAMRGDSMASKIMCKLLTIVNHPSHVMLKAPLVQTTLQHYGDSIISPYLTV